MSLFIAGRSIPHVGQLSTLCGKILAFVDGGQQWLQWAINASEHRYHFDDERALLDGVQQGLHGTRLLWLPSIGLQVSPIKLLSVGSVHLDALQRFERGDHSSVLSDQVSRMLETHSLVTNAQLQAYRPFLASIGVADAPLLLQPDFREALALYRLAQENNAPDAPACAEAASFALQQARSPLEFCDYYRFYLQGQYAGSRRELRHEHALHVLQTLLPVLLAALDGPQLSQLPSPEQVRLAIAQSLAASRQIGYARISLAAQQCGLALRGQPLDHDLIRESARSHMRDAQAFLNEHPVRAGKLGQDGASVDFPIEATDQQATVRVEENVITLANYSRLLGHGDTVPAPGKAQPMPFPPPVPSTPDGALPHHKTPMEIAQELADAAMAASEEGIRAAMDVSRRAVEAANEAARRADAAAEEAVRRAAEADIARPMPFPPSLPSPPGGGLPHQKTPMEIAQELVDAAMAASEEGIRAAMDVSRRAVEAANEAARRADAAAEEAVRRAAEANGEDADLRDGHR